MPYSLFIRVMSTLLYATVLSWRSGDMRGESGRVWTAECTRGRGHLIPTLRDRQTMIAGGGVAIKHRKEECNTLQRGVAGLRTWPATAVLTLLNQLLQSNQMIWWCKLYKTSQRGAQHTAERSTGCINWTCYSCINSAESAVTKVDQVVAEWIRRLPRRGGRRTSDSR